VYFCYRKDCPELWIVVLEVSVIHSSHRFWELPHSLADPQYIW
jgi:hypothetical protein